MRKTIFIMLAAIVAALAGCARNEEGVSSLSIMPSIRTRVTGLHFDAGDQIGLTVTSVTGVYADNRPLTYNGSFFSGDLAWYRDANEKSTLTAYYPYSDKGTPAVFDIALDQSGGCGSSDLLGAVKSDVTPASAPVGMVFYHLMSEVKIVVNNSTDAVVSGVTVSGFAPTAEVDLANLTAKVKSGAAPADVSACEQTAGTSYRVLLVPQTGNLTFTVFTTDNKNYSKTLSTSLESGYTYDVTVEMEEESISVQLSGEIGDWTSGGSLDGQPEEEPGTVTCGDETYRTRTIGGRVWMAENMRNIPADAQIGTGVWNPVGGPGAVASQGMLYDHATAVGDAAAAAQGVVRGICPEGWHIPDADELATLVQADCGDDFFSCASWWILSTGIGKYGIGTKGYLMSATLSAENKRSCLSFTTTGVPPSMSALSTEYGLSLRCIKDK